MKIKIICLSFIFLIFIVHSTPAKTLYTWTDKDGVVHITETKPPADAKTIEKNNYRTEEKQSLESPDKKENVQRKNPMQEYNARNSAKRARREADIARKDMEAAIENANRMKAETDVYIEQWGIQARTRKSIKAKIDRKKEETNRAVAEAQRLTDIATQAEVKAREAEKQLAELNEPSDKTGATNPANPTP